MCAGRWGSGELSVHTARRSLGALFWSKYRAKTTSVSVQTSLFSGKNIDLGDRCKEGKGGKGQTPQRAQIGPILHRRDHPKSAN